MQYNLKQVAFIALLIPEEWLILLNLLNNKDSMQLCMLLKAAGWENLDNEIYRIPQ